MHFTTLSSMQCTTSYFDFWRTKQNMSDAAWQPGWLLYLPASVADGIRGVSVPGLVS